jgi:hypothetical protein
MGQGFLKRRQTLRTRVLRGVELIEARGAMPSEAELARLQVRPLEGSHRGEPRRYVENVQLAGAAGARAQKLADRLDVTLEQLVEAAFKVGSAE